MLKSGPPLLRPPPFLPLLAHSRSPESRSSCLADRNLCRRGAWGWRARDRQQTGSTSRGVGGDKHWRTQLRGGAGREHGKRRHSGAALTGQATTEGSPPWRRVLGSPVLHLPQQPPAGVPHSAQKSGEPLHWRAGQRKSPALDYPRALRSPRLGAHRLRGCLEYGACAPMRQPQA